VATLAACTIPIILEEARSLSASAESGENEDVHEITKEQTSSLETRFQHWSSEKSSRSRSVSIGYVRDRQLCIIQHKLTSPSNQKMMTVLSSLQSEAAQFHCDEGPDYLQGWPTNVIKIPCLAVCLEFADSNGSCYLVNNYIIGACNNTFSCTSYYIHHSDFVCLGHALSSLNHSCTTPGLSSSSLSPFSKIPLVLDIGQAF
jgi:hypothetical protein